jgi:uncharacterized membrane protein
LAWVYPLALKIFDNRRVALLSLIIFALSEPFIWYSQIARPYSLALSFSLVSFWSFISLERKATKAARTVYVFSTALTVYAHYLFGLIVIIQALYLVVVRAGLRVLLSKLWLMNFLALALLLAPSSGQVFYLHSRRHALDWVTSVDSSWKIAGGIIYIIGAASPIAIFATALALATLGFRWSELKLIEIRSKRALPIVWYMTPLLLFSIVPVLIGVNLTQPRYLLFAYPATYLLLAWLMLNVRTTGYRKWLPAAVFIASTILSVSVPALNSTQTFARWPNRSWNDALATLARLYKPDSIVVAQVGLVEADLLANDSYDPKLLSYLSWPLVTTLPGLKEKNIFILPYRLTDRTQVYFNSLVDGAAKHSRIWLVGGGDLVSLFQDRLVHDLNYRVASQSRHGDEFHVFVLERGA